MKIHNAIIFMAGLVLCCTSFMSAQSQPPTSGVIGKEGQPPQNQSGTIKAQSENAAPMGTPVSSKSDMDSSYCENETQNSASKWSDPVTWFTLALVGVGITQCIIYHRQWKAMREALDASTEQSKAMERRIDEASRLANAAEISADAGTKAADVVDKRTAQQMRAYICVLAGGMDVQNQAAGVFFAGKAIIMNAGHTPAHDVKYKIRAAIMNFPTTADMVFPPAEREIVSGMVGPQQTMIMTAAVPKFEPDESVPGIMNGGAGRALYVWGSISYKDVFKENQKTEFCHSITWNGIEGKPAWVTFISSHNKGS